jgi:hypothetical protein
MTALAAVHRVGVHPVEARRAPEAGDEVEAAGRQRGRGMPGLLGAVEERGVDREAHARMTRDGVPF